MKAENNLSQAERDALVLSCQNIVKHFARVKGIAWGDTPSRNWKDIEQMAWVGVVRAARQYIPGGPSSFKTFAYSVVRDELRGAAKAYGAQKRPQKRERGFGEKVNFMAFRDDSPVPFAGESASERNAEMEVARGKMVRDCKTWMTKKQFEVMRLLMAGMRKEEIRERLNIKRTSLDSLIDRARTTARNYLYSHAIKIREIAAA